jgi:hypothetical protein
MMLIPAFFFFFARSGFLDRLKKTALMALMVILTLTPWVVRNYMHFGKVFVTSSSGGVVLWMCYRPMSVSHFYHLERAYAYVDSVGWREARIEEFYRILVEDNIFGIKGAIEAFKEYYPGEQFPENDVEFNQVILQKIKEEQLINPRIVALKMVKDFLRHWHFFDGRGNYIFSYGALLPFFFAGLWLLRKRLWEMRIFLAFFLYQWGLGIVFQSGGRYRMPFEIVMIVIGAFALWELFRRVKPIVIPIAICTVVLGVNLYFEANPLALRYALRSTASSIGIPVTGKDSDLIPSLEKDLK